MKQLLLLSFTLSLFIINGQELTDKDYASYPHWQEMMQDPGINFFEVQKAFNLYYEGKDMKQERGWKQYKRWEENTKRYINPDGSRIAASRNYLETQKFFTTSNSKTAGNWTNLGPTIEATGASGVGRINAIAFHPTDENILYIGAPAGGLWKTTDHGDHWIALTDQLPTMGVSSIVIDYSNPSILYFGSGDRDAGDAIGLGVFKSTDGGQNWILKNEGMGEKTVGRLLQSPSDANTLIAATTGGIYKSTDAGDNWIQMINGNFKDLVYKPGSSSVLYASKGAILFKSIDSGDTWEDISGSMMGGSRSVIAVTAANPNIVYFLITGGNEFSALYKSTNSGENFSLKSTTPNIMSWGCNGGSGGQAWYDLDMAASDFSENKIFAGGVNCFMSSNGGSNWNISSHWYGDCGVSNVHADLHILEVNPLNNRIYTGNDGGIFYTANEGSSWQSIAGDLSIHQIYRIGSSKTIPNKVMVGAQDNGSTAYLGSYWKKVYGGDGMDCLVDHTNVIYAYASLYYGDLFRIINNGSNVKIAGEGVNGMTESGAWVTPYCLSEFDHNVMFVGMKHIWRTTSATGSVSWTNLDSPGGGDITITEASRADENMFYFSRGKNLYRSDNVLGDSPNWINLTSYVPDNNDIYTIETDPDNPDIVWVGKGTKLYQSEDRGITWENISENLPNVNLNSVVYYSFGSKGLYVGGDLGVFYRDTNMDEWISFSEGLPIDASVREVEFYHDNTDPSNDLIRVGTFGRGLWESSIWTEAPSADFTVDYATISPSCGLNFSDLSSGNPMSWEWTFEGGTPATSSEQNPSNISFANAGTYDVTLTVSNTSGNDSKTMNAYITVSDNLLPEIEFSASQTAICSGNTVELYDESIYCPTSWEWSFSPNTISFVEGTSAFSQNPVILFNESGQYTVSLNATNVNGTETLEKAAFIQAGGYEVPFADDFESLNSIELSNWTISNPDGMTTWELITAPREETDNQAIYLNLYNYFSQAGSKDMLISPPLDFTNVVETPTVKFKHAYARRFTTHSDTLHIYGSNDCGASWEKLNTFYISQEGVFETVPAMPSFEFIPESADDWSYFTSVQFPQYQGMNNIKIGFELVNNFGNNIFLDDIEFIDLPLAVQENQLNKSISIYPNPAKAVLYVNTEEGKYELKIFTLLGDEVVKRNFEGKMLSLNVVDLKAGIYMIQLINIGTDQIETQKLIIE